MSRSPEFGSISDGKNFKIPYLSGIKATSIEIIKLENFSDIFLLGK